MTRWVWLGRERNREVVVWGVAALAVLPVVLVPVIGATYRVGLPAVMIRGIGLVPDIIVGGLVVLGVVVAWRSRQRPNPVDVAVAVATAVVLGVWVLAQFTGPWRDVSFEREVLSLRAILWGLWLLVGVRSISLPAHQRDRIANVVVVAAAVLAAGAVVEAAVPHLWEWVWRSVFPVREVQRSVFGSVVPEDIVIRSPVAGRSLVRAGSLLFEYLQLGFILVPGLAIALARAARRVAIGPITAVVVIAAGITATLGRTVIVVAAVVAVLVVLTREHRAERRRLLVAGVTAVAVVVAMIAPTGMAARLMETVRGQEGSTTIHQDATAGAWREMVNHPFGVGLGTGIAASARAPDDTHIAENAYLDIALQVGWSGLAAVVVALAAAMVTVWRRRPWDDLATGAMMGLVGLALGGLLLHTWQMLEVSWLVLGMAGCVSPREE